MCTYVQKKKNPTAKETEQKQDLKDMTYLIFSGKARVCIKEIWISIFCFGIVSNLKVKSVL